MSSSDFPNPPGFPSPPGQDPDAEVLAEHALSIRDLSKRVIADVIEIGRRLSECKKLLGHGNWLLWLRHEFRWSERTARNFISAFEFAQSISAKFSDLRIEVSSIYLLASPSTPEKGRAEVLRRAEAGEKMTYAKVKHVVHGARDDGTARSSKESRIGIKDIKEYYADFFSLPPAEQSKIIKKGPKNIELAIADATTRHRWALPYRELHDALDALDALAKRSISKIITSIPVAHIIGIEARVETANDFLIKLDARLKRDNIVHKTSTADDATSLANLLSDARKNNIKKYGRTTQAQVLETIWPELNPAQVAALLSGQYGQVIKATAERLVAEKHKPDCETPQRRRRG